MTTTQATPSIPQLRDVDELRAIVREMLDIIELFLVEKAGGGTVGPEALNLMNLYCGSLKPLVSEGSPDGSGDDDPTASDDRTLAGGEDGGDLPGPGGADSLL